ncbi:MAG: RNA polymerase factor sigma-32 [Halobacteriovoraceae bacterium]|jgi:RNA polymerase sigma-32 factor|nr:RNA polymerase factor sigma-32 [Halobacteriovoraceae bacterium]
MSKLVKNKNDKIEILDAELAEVEPVKLDTDSIIDVSTTTDKTDLEIIQGILPTVPSSKALTTKGSVTDQLYLYLNEISKYKLLSREEEEDLVNKLYETGDIEVAKKLVVANLRLVVKIAMEYKSSYKNISDLIQEGNIGLMKAVSKYDPTKGAKLSYYASWWIKSYILKFILDNFRLIKIGTTADQKKLFYNLMREKERLMNQGIEPEVKLISENLGVSEKSVEEMNLRLSTQGAEVSIDTPLSSEGSTATLGDLIEDEKQESIEDSLGHQQSLKILEDNLENFLNELNQRDQEIFKKRLLSEVPLSLQSIANDYGVSRERIRQIEARLLGKLKVYMSEFIR